MFHGRVEIAAANLRVPRTRGLQKIGQSAADAADFQPDILHHRPCRAGGGQIATDDLDDAGNSGQRIANLVGQPGGQLAESGEVFGARHLGAMQALNLFAALAQLLHHVIEVAAEIADFVVALGEADRDVQIAFPDELHFLLEFDHGPLNQVGKYEHGDGADRHRSRASHDQHGVAFRIASGYRGQSEEQQPCQQNEADRQHRLELPIDAHRTQAQAELVLMLIE